MPIIRVYDRWRLFQRVALITRFRFWAPLRANRHASWYISHSQFGEDMVLRSLLNDVQEGFYVDIGAHHPVYLSNTYHFYRRGWRGINVDATPGSMMSFAALRPRDTNLEVCVSDSDERNVSLFVFDVPAYNTTDEATAAEVIRRARAQLLRTVALRTMTLASCLDRHLPPKTEIDFLTIDVEGADEAVIAGNDWARYRPRAIVLERHNVSLLELAHLPIVQKALKFGYLPVAKCGPSLILTQAL